ncbi:hypothetical protein COS93_00880 [bacterium (Candidatus Gribaldobacteria) CG07_land_8_20_14_0_80_33_18]|uniref:Nitroreductase domain-containing protein n=1 Tax=bacterium (Candidatus Gribaldobacteria) CG07_land_8_20_14_0_80_33_18 TaxID=2014272 RepID=A0A2M6Z3W3_9BACT|nr:MAG: hypothetical protein COU04_01590 [bacterium (Candidatus Gribaldobacteria) CG10_big_fil_rev_8_21_14_0_10_33_41]PIU47066.1 MAG: hypothetical protein COS93_00880 [bacterium (Candidatus Gribaldobacteria) CG07_land_8_20_14_0_80_33_18]PJA01296.1 MAG: hypothetical protein COX75_00175 [bacterium (Candidatus Gribaldobacteria) CG_4_10_14_0_2_um_filter_33_15]PJB08987.1 MAG: hypothetical protein CO122_00445 [bacterium (Candidatus Gribaldobacteria) CG_4_9_14_3_um_filter_33_9]
MEVKEAIKKRRSVRAYKPTLVPEEKLKIILEAARLAPSAHNNQEWKFIVVKDEKKNRRNNLRRRIFLKNKKRVSPLRARLPSIYFYFQKLFLISDKYF